MGSPIPSPQYVTDTIDGAVYKVTDTFILLLGDVPPALAGVNPLVSGKLIVRYGLTLLVPPGVILIPGLFAAEKGGMLVGREAWDFIQRNFTVHPRGDVLGIGINGVTIQAFIREIDFGVPPKVVIYAGPDAFYSIAEVTEMIVGNNAPVIPELLERYLPLRHQP